MILLFGIHCHQPVGNFEFVFEDIYDRSYKPFIKEAYKHSDFKFAVHVTGVLWEWVAKKHPEFVSLLKEMLGRGQIELLSGAYYEAVLNRIPSKDRRLQIAKLNAFIEDVFGVKPTGMWLAERVWSSEIVSDIVLSGIKYTLVDDYHFVAAGFGADELRGYYLTEYGGDVLAIFPISKRLRYYIPFKPVNDVLSYMKAMDNDVVISFFDDGEKFGAWPSTYDWIYKGGWLASFMESVSTSGDISLMHFSDILSKARPTGRCYLPMASYFEMGKWSLPPNRQIDFDKAGKLLVGSEMDDYALLRGGIWDNFLIKYPESNWMHKRVLGLSKLCKDDNPAMDYILRAECNDPYWHGVFGGIYLPHLRHAVYKNIIAAESILEGGWGVKVEDVDKDGKEEIRLFDKRFLLYIKPFDGGSVVELDDMKSGFNYLDTISRRFESYHVVEAGEDGSEDATIESIHSVKRLSDTHDIYYDMYQRHAFRDHLLDSLPSLQELYESRVSSESNGDYEFYSVGNSVVLWSFYDGKALLVKKRFSLQKDGLNVGYLLRNMYGGEKQFLFASELNLALPELDDVTVRSGDIQWEVGRQNYLQKVNEVLIQGRDFSIGILIDGSVGVFYYPVYTVFRTEYGFDRIFQEACMWLVTPVVLGGGRTHTFSISIKIS